MFLKVLRQEEKMNENKEEERKKGAKLWAQSIKKRRLLRNENLLDLPESEFIKLCELPRALVRRVLSAISPKMKRKRRSDGVAPEVKLLATLHLLTSGAYQSDVGNHLNLSQSSISRYLHEIIPLIVSELKNEVHFPVTDEERTRVATGFRRLGPFEGVLGVMDCTHIQMSRPRDDEWDFVNPKGVHSLNVLMICDSDLRILYVMPNSPGSVTDQCVWSECDVYHEMNNLHSRHESNYYLLGDSEFDPEPFLLTPKTCAEASAEEYTKAHYSVMNTIERMFEMLKSRFRVLRETQKIAVSPEVVAGIVSCCAILHNLCLSDFSEIVEQPGAPEVAITPTPEVKSRQNSRRTEALMKRQSIIEKYFS